MKTDPLVIVVARQAGTANAFFPVIQALRRLPVDLHLLALGQAEKIWRELDLPFASVASFSDARPYLQSNGRPCFLLTGTSFEAMDDSRFWAWARHAAVPSLAFVDHWVNLDKRFFLEHSGSQRDLRLPDKIATIDDPVAQQLIQLGCPETRLMVCGHPVFDSLIDQRNASHEPYRQRLTPQGTDHLLCFVSEPYSASENPPFTEQTVLELILETANRWCQRHQRRCHLLIRPHPLEDPANWSPFIASSLHPTAVTTELFEGDRHIGVRGADGVLGMTSLLLYEAFLLGKQVLSVQPQAASHSDPFAGSLPLSMDGRGIEAFLDRALLSVPNAFPVPAPLRATEHLVGYIAKQLNLTEFE